MRRPPRRRSPDGSTPVAGARADAGMSLAELLVAIGLLAMIGTLVTATAVLMLRTTTAAQVRVEDAVTGETTLAAVSKVLRTAVLPTQLDNQSCTGCQGTAITVASGKEIRFYANLDNSGIGPSFVTLRVEQDPDRPQQSRLVQSTQAPTPTGQGSYTFCNPATAGCTVRTRTVGRALVRPAKDIFTFYDYDGAPMGSSVLAAADLRRVSSIDVVVTVQTRPGDPKHPARTALTRVRLPNVEINVVDQS